MTGDGQSILGLIFGTLHCGRIFDCSTDLDSSGGIVLWFLLMIYMFKQLGTICDEYFVPSLEVIVEKLEMSNDVAGATFMAAGSSAPELFTSLVATFLIVNEGGVGTIVGSAIFNILVIVGATGWVACKDQSLRIWWYPLARDSAFYTLSILELLVVLWDEEVKWYEGLVMIFTYLLYCGYMKVNSRIMEILNLERLEAGEEAESDEPVTISHTDASSWQDPVTEARLPAPPDPDATVEILHTQKGCWNGCVTVSAVVKNAELPNAVPIVSGSGASQHIEKNFTELKSGVSESVGLGPHLKPTDSATTGRPHSRSGSKDSAIKWSMHQVAHESHHHHRHSGHSRECLEQASVASMSTQGGISLAVVPTVTINTVSTPSETTAAHSPDGFGKQETTLKAGTATLPVDGTQSGTVSSFSVETQLTGVWRFLRDPLSVVLKCLMPSAENHHWLLFSLSITFIGAATYLMVDATNRIGVILKVPPLVMGLIFLAAGTSIPDALGSITVAKQGEGDMAVANALGSNVFDILIGLGVPWTIRCAMGKKVKFEEVSMIGDIIILVGVLSLFVGSLLLNRWRLTRLLGGVLCFFYVLWVLYNVLAVWVFETKKADDE